MLNQKKGGQWIIGTLFMLLVFTAFVPVGTAADTTPCAILFVQPSNGPNGVLAPSIILVEQTLRFQYRTQRLVKSADGRDVWKDIARDPQTLVLGGFRQTKNLQRVSIIDPLSTREFGPLFGDTGTPLQPGLYRIRVDYAVTLGDGKHCPLGSPQFVVGDAEMPTKIETVREGNTFSFRTLPPVNGADEVRMDFIQDSGTGSAFVDSRTVRLDFSSDGWMSGSIELPEGFDFARKIWVKITEPSIPANFAESYTMLFWDPVASSQPVPLPSSQR